MSSDARRSVLFLTRTLLVGGAERQLVVLANSLVARGHKVVVAALYDQVPLAAGLAPAVELVTLGKRGRWDVARFGAKLVRLVRRVQPDVLHGWLVVPNLLVTCMRPIVPRARIVWGVRAADMDWSLYDGVTRGAFWLSRRFAPAADLIVTNSEAGLQYHGEQGYPAASMRVLPNGIDVSLFSPAPDRATRVRANWAFPAGTAIVGFVARVDPIKDHETFLEAIGLARHGGAAIGAVCVGASTPEGRRALEAGIERHGLSRWVLVRDAEPDLAAAYSAMTILCLSSRSEGFPNVVAEAMACGVPCVVTDVGDARQIVDGTGAVVPVGQPRALARSIADMVGRVSPELARACRARIVERYSAERVGERAERLLFGLGGHHG